MTIYGPKKGVAFKVRLPLVTYGTGDWKAAPTIAAGDWKISKDGGALANLATLPTVAPVASAWVLLDLSATEMDADVIQLQGIDQTATKEWEDTGAVIYTTAQGSGASVPQTGDSFARIGATGSGLTSLAQASVATEARLARLDENVSAAKTLTVAERNSVADALLDRTDGIETGWTFRKAFRLVAAVLAGKASGGPGGTAFRDLTDTKARVTVTADSSGNRAAVTLDGT
ncbi:MAG TPA: hypothetical protein VEA38_12145 [Terriglobales bacterium]|nr:hypothetical protein [Terriglobales bacterium]